MEKVQGRTKKLSRTLRATLYIFDFYRILKGEADVPLFFLNQLMKKS